MQDFKQLKVWNKAHQLTLKIYLVTKLFPKDELYGLVSQMKRSSTSISTNIAEGCGRGSKADLNRFLQFAIGSSNELEYQLILSRDLSFIDENKFSEITGDLVEIRKMIYSFGKTRMS